MKFDTAIRELERIVKDLESQDMPLEKALVSFEEGIKLTRHCSSLLEEAEQKVKLLTRDAETCKVVQSTWTDKED